jgi:hypothetical protein
MNDDEQAPELPDSDDDGVTIAYPHSLFLYVGAVAVMGARVEVALVRLLRHMETRRLSEPHKEVMWLETEKAIRQGLANIDPAVADEVLETLDWASTLDLRGRRNDAIHTEYPLLPGEQGVFSTRIARNKPAEITGYSYGDFFARLKETHVLLGTFLVRLDDVTYWMTRPSWHRQLLPRPGGSETWQPSTP